MSTAAPISAGNYKPINDMTLEYYTSKFKILRIKKREYTDGIKSKETRPGWGEAHSVYKACVGTTEGFKASICT